MAKPDKVLLSFIPGRGQKIVDFGREHSMQTQQGSLRKGSICRQIIDFIINLRHHEVYDRILKTEGLTLFQLVERALFDYAAKGGYIRKRR